MHNRTVRPACAWLFVAACTGEAGPVGRGPPTFARPEVVLPEVRVAPVTVPNLRPVEVTQLPLLPPIVRGPHQIDEFRQVPALVDVLWVVDNSGSLSNERARLVNELDQFLAVLIRAEADFHIGVTSTDMTSTGDGGRLRGPVIDRRTPRPREAFARALDFPEDRTVTLEEGLMAMFAALSPPLIDGVNAGFLRPEAGLAVIIASDEDDGSLGPAGFYTRFLESSKGPGREVDVSFSAVVGDLPDGCSSRGDENVFGAAAEPGLRYAEVANATGGLFESICSPDFAPFVETLAKKISGLNTRFILSAPPRIASIHVRVNGVEIPQDAMEGWSWSLDDRAVVFSGAYVPPPNARIEIEYDLDL